LNQVIVEDKIAETFLDRSNHPEILFHDTEIMATTFHSAVRNVRGHHFNHQLWLHNFGAFHPIQREVEASIAFAKRCRNHEKHKKKQRLLEISWTEYVSRQFLKRNF
jgi:hypothetical protein